MRTRFLSLIAAASAVSCSPAPPPQDDEFVNLAERYVEELLERYPEYATSLGDHRYDGLLNDYTAQGVEEAVRWNRDFLDALASIDPARLSTANAVDLAILRNEIEYGIWSAEVLREHEWNPMLYGVGNAIYSLLAREFAPLEQRLESVKRRLTGVGAVFEAERANLGRPPKTHTETAIRQNDGAISLVSEELDRFLEEAPAMKPELEEVRRSAISALEDRGRWLREELLPRSDGEFRIGEERFRTKLRFALHSELSMEEILSRAEQRLAQLQERMYATALPLYREFVTDESRRDEGNRGTVIRTVLDRLADSHPTDTSIVEDARLALEDVARFTEDRNLVSVPDEPLQIIVMPEFRRGYSTAYCDSPGPLEEDGETFYAISPTPERWTAERKLSFYREYNDYMLQTLTAHEAIPGHYLQIAHSNQAQLETKIRSVFSSGTFVEGWAVYSEQVLAEQGYGGAPFRMQQLKMQTRAVINAILDQKIHAGSMTEQEAMDMMLQQGYQEDGEAAGKWIRAQLSSTQLSTYFVGVAEHEDLRRAWEERNGPIEDFGAYHDLVLSFGSPPVRFVRQLMGL